MIPALAAALMVRAARTLPAGRRERVVLVSRPRGVTHVAVSALTPSGRWIPAAGRTVCHTRTRRLAVLQRRNGLPDLAERRICRRCLTVLTARTNIPGLDDRPMTREEETEAFELLTPVQLTTIAASCTTVDETHQVGRLGMVLFGPTPMKPPARRTVAEQQIAALHDTVHAVRRRLTVAAMSDEQRAATVRQRDQETAEHARIQLARRRVDARDRIEDRRRAGSYLAPHERDRLRSA